MNKYLTYYWIATKVLVHNFIHVTKVNLFGSPKVNQTSKIIVVCGSPRSGSTWQYNFIRLALKEAGFSVYGSFIRDYNPLRKEQYHVVKTHNYIHWLKKRAHKIISSTRDVKGVQTSLTRIYGRYDKSTLYRSYCMWIPWEENADYNMSYGDFQQDKLTEAKHILKTLALRVNPQKILDEVDKLKNLKKGTFKDNYDKETLLHPNHRS